MAHLSHLPKVRETSRSSAAMKEHCSPMLLCVEFLTCMTHNHLDTFIAPADLLPSSQFKKVQGHRAISGR